MRHALFAFILCCHCYASAQLNGKYSFRHLDQTNGLLHTHIKGVGQDAKGFIWILSWNGLQRFDGSRFEDFPEVINQSSFGTMHDGQLYVDTLNDQVWVIKGDHIERLDLATRKMNTIPLEKWIDDYSNSDSRLFTHGDHTKWWINKYGVITYDSGRTTTLGAYFNLNVNQHHQNTFVIEDPVTGDYWLHNFNHLMIADIETHRIQSSGDLMVNHPFLKYLKSIYGSRANKIRYLLLDSHVNLWVSTWDHFLYRYNIDTEQTVIYSLKEIMKSRGDNHSADLPFLVNAMYEDRQKNLWIGTDHAGLLLYNKEADNFNYITSDEKISNGVKYNFSITTIFQDRKDNIWLGTDRGISIFNPYRNFFQTIRHIDEKESSVPKNDINDVVQTQQGEILIATWGGGISICDQNWNFIRNVAFKKSLSLNLVWSLVEHDDGTIWAGTQEGYIHVYNPVTHTFQTIQPPEIDHSTINKMVKDQEGNIYLGLHNGKMVFWNKKEKAFHKYEGNESTHAWPLKGVVDIFIDKFNRCWVTSASGLQKFDKDELRYTDLYQPFNTIKENGITFQGVEAFNDTMLIMGAIYGGTHLFNTNTTEFSRLKINDHLNNTSVFAIKKDHAGDFWFTTDYSLHKLSSDHRSHTKYNTNNSIITSPFASSGFYILNDGRWVTYTHAEILSFDPVQTGFNPPAIPKIEISGFKVFDESIYIDSFLANNRAVILPYHKNFISIEFSALDFSDLKQTNFYYRLSDVDKNWIHAMSKNFADYTDLKPGKYIFEVKAAEEASSITSFPIIITPPWWGTLWFRVIALFAIIAMITLILRRRIHMIRKEADLKHQIVQTEMMALRSQMNPHFIFNCINGIDAMIQSNDKYRATMYLNKFAKLIRNVLDSSKQNRVPLSKDMETLQLYIDLELFRHQDKFSAAILIGEDLLQEDYKVPPLIIQPYVENAILHGLRPLKDQHGKLTVTVSKSNDNLVYVIEDNGVGRKNLNGQSNKQQNGYGMQMSNDRVRLFNAEEIASIHITDLESQGQPAGTRIQVQLKIQ